MSATSGHSNLQYLFFSFLEGIRRPRQIYKKQMIRYNWVNNSERNALYTVVHIQGLYSQLKVSHLFLKCNARSASLVCVPVDNLHGSASKHKGGADHDREAQLLGLVQGTGLVRAHATRRLLDVQLGQDLVPLVPVLSIIYALGLCAPDLHIALACHQQPLLALVSHCCVSADFGA